MSPHARIGVAVLLLNLAACVSSTSGGHHAPHGPTPAAAPGVTDVSDDWHGLVLVPFGTLLKDSPIALHEVLLFHDQAHDETHGSGDMENRDCYAIDGAPPRFVGRQPDQYLLCFEHDRLNRIDASVRLPADEAAQVFTRACGLWMKSAAPMAGSGGTCEGRDGDIAFSAHLGLVPGEASMLTMTLSDSAVHETMGRPGNDAVHDAAHEK